MELEVRGEIWFWKGPAPWHFITVPEAESLDVEATSAVVSYGWGMIPVTARIGATEWETSLFPKETVTSCPSRRRCGEPKSSSSATSSLCG
jgi:Domain of unknown function (DUF1905)